MTGYRSEEQKCQSWERQPPICVYVCPLLCGKEVWAQKKPDDFVEQLTDAHAEWTDHYICLAVQRYALVFIRQRKKAEIFVSALKKFREAPHFLFSRCPIIHSLFSLVNNSPNLNVSIKSPSSLDRENSPFSMMSIPMTKSIPSYMHSASTA